MTVISFLGALMSVISRQGILGNLTWCFLFEHDV